MSDSSFQCSVMYHHNSCWPFICSQITTWFEFISSKISQECNFQRRPLFKRDSRITSENLASVQNGVPMGKLWAQLFSWSFCSVHNAIYCVQQEREVRERSSHGEPWRKPHLVKQVCVSMLQSTVQCGVNLCDCMLYVFSVFYTFPLLSLLI